MIDVTADVSRGGISSKLILTSIVGFSLVFSLVHAGPLRGSILALLLVVTMQLYLPGWLLLNGLHINSSRNPIVRFAWGLAVGLSLTIPLAGMFRVLLWPVENYLLTLHAFMFVLVYLQKPAPETLDWSTLKRQWYLYAALAVFCLIGLTVGIERSQLRINGWEDQTVFISAATWLAHDPPDLALPSRQVSATAVERYRWVTDGWTYQHAAWEWITGISSATIIWNLITPLFAWLTPILTFALAYELSSREHHALYCAAGLTLASLLSIESLVYLPTVGYGQNYFAQMNTLRMFSSSIMLPLTLMVGIAYLRRPEKQKAVIILVALVALGILHPRQITIAAVTFTVLGGLLWLTARTRAHFFTTCVLTLLVVLALAIPLAQDALLRAQGVAASMDAGNLLEIEDDAPSLSAPNALPNGLLHIGNFLIVDPHIALDDPLVVIASVLGLTMPIWGWKRPENLFSFGMTLAMLLLLFTPGIAGLFIKVVTPRIASTFILMLPIGIIFGTVSDHAINLIRKARRFVEPATAVGLAMIALALIFEPFPISASAKDRITAVNQVQSERNILPADQSLLNLFGTAPDLQITTPTVILVPNRIANYIVESIPYAEVVGGRQAENPQVQAQVDRFYVDGNLASPFLDSDDLQLIAHWGVQLIVTETDDARTAALLLQPDRFQLLHQGFGYLVFRVLKTQATPEDALFKQMNSLYTQTKPQRWLKGDFDFNQPGTDAWDTFAAQWQDRLTAQTNDDLARYGAAASLLLAGNDGQALPDWVNLQQTYPQISLFRQAAAHTMTALGQTDNGRDLLLTALSDSDNGTRAVAARTLLQPAFFPSLNPAQIGQIVTAIQTSPAAWNLLAVYDQPESVRRYAALLIADGSLAAADEQLATISPISMRPEDLETRAAILLSQQNVDGALALLKPYLDPDAYAAAASIHPDRWQVNSAAGLYDLIEGGLAARRNDMNAAVADYRNAANQGMVIAGNIFLARLQTAAGDLSAAKDTLNALDQSGADNAHYWYLVGLSELDNSTQDIAGAQAAEAQAEPLLAQMNMSELPRLRSPIDIPANLQTSISDVNSSDKQSIDVTAEFGQINLAQYTVKNWQAIVFDPITYQRYGELTLSALFVPGAVTELYINLPLNSTPESKKVGIFVESFNELVHYAGVYAFTDLNQPSASNQGSW